MALNNYQLPQSLHKLVPWTPDSKAVKVHVSTCKCGEALSPMFVFIHLLHIF